MKKIIFLIVVMASVLGSCKQNSTDNTNNHLNHNNDDNMMMFTDSTMMHNASKTMENHEKMYTCPMHSEIIGKKDDKCSKCSMKLTEPILEKKLKSE
jgi:Ni/Co efflux regulator RcnB